MVETPVTPDVETPATPETPVTPAPPAPPAPSAFNWKSQLPSDFANSPTMQKYPDTKEGFTDAVKSHLELQKLMGHEKVPIPKGPNDTVAMEVFRKALRIPDKPDGYQLPDVQVSENMNIPFDKKGFSETIHKHNITPDQAKGLWQDYTEMAKKQYAEAVKKHQDEVATAITQLRSEWGEAYDSKVQLGQMVLNKFSESQEMNDFLTATLVKDPRGIKFLSKLGEQFAENKIGDFKYQRHSLTPEEAQREIDSIRGDMNHPYNNEKAPKADRDKAIDYVNNLYGVVSRARTR